MKVAVAAPKDKPAGRPAGRPFNARREIAELREMMAQADARIRVLEERLGDLAPGPASRPPSTSELVGQAVLAWFEEHPGLKVTPGLLEMNLDGKLPGAGKAAVVSACRNLAKAGKLRSTGPSTGQAASRRIYWLAESTD